MKNHHRKYMNLFMLILVIGLCLRLYDLTEENIWVDEAYSINIASYQTYREILDSVKATEGAPPGYYFLLHYWINFFSDGEFAVRSFSVLFGVLSIIIIYLIGKLLVNKKVGLISALFLSTSMLQVLYSQEARLYSLYGFLVLAAGYFFVRILKDKYILKNYIFFFLFMVVAFYVNYMTGPLILLFFLLSLWKKDYLRWKTWFLTIFGIILAVLPLLSLILVQFNTSYNGAEKVLVAKGIPSFLAQLGPILWLIPVLFLLIVLALLIVMKSSMKSSFEKHTLPDSLVLVLIVMLGVFYTYLSTHALSILGLKIIRKPIIHSYALIRHSYFLIPLLYLFIAVKINSMKKKMVVISLLIIIFVNIFALTVYYSQPTKPQWQEALEFVGSNSETKSPVLLIDSGGFSSNFLVSYYGEEEFELIPLTWSKRKRVKANISDGDLLEELKNEEEFWLILSRNKNNHYKEMLDAKYDLTLEHAFYQMEVFKYEKSDDIKNIKEQDGSYNNDHFIFPLYMGAREHSFILAERGKR